MFIGIKVMWNITRGILLHNLENKNLAKKICLSLPSSSL